MRYVDSNRRRQISAITKGFCQCLCVFLCVGSISAVHAQSAAKVAGNPKPNYEWTKDHIQIGVRWQPFVGRPANNAFDAKRPVIATESSYIQFWMSWPGVEPRPEYRDYQNRPSKYLQAIDAAVDYCNTQGIKVEFVFFHCPAWAAESGKQGGWKPKKNHFRDFVARVAKHFKGRVEAYQLSHESNLRGYLQDGDIDFLLSEVMVKGAQAIRDVYAAEPAMPVLVSTSGCSPCQNCSVLKGLKGQGGAAVNDFYDRLIAEKSLMQLVDGLNMNLTDTFDGYGNMDGSFVSSAWGNYDLVRRKLDKHYPGKTVFSAESWVTWDSGRQATDVNGDGVKNETDAYLKTLTLLGRCLERGLNTSNLPWSDNSSAWAMGLTKRRDYNGRIAQLRPDIVVPASDNGPAVVTRKLMLPGNDDNFQIKDGTGDIFTANQYCNPRDPNHLHYYIWRWFAQLSGGTDEVIRHAIAGEIGNDIAVVGTGYTGAERYRLASFNRTMQMFTVLIYSAGANGKQGAKVTIPATIQNGRHYNNQYSKIDFRGEGFAEGERFSVRIESKDISLKDGTDRQPIRMLRKDLVVQDDVLTVHVPRMQRFTKLEFFRQPAEPTANGLPESK